jgi:hypothetical protein
VGLGDQVLIAVRAVAERQAQHAVGGLNRGQQHGIEAGRLRQAQLGYGQLLQLLGDDLVVL